MTHSPNSALEDIGKLFGLRIGDQLKVLLQSKHLYQSVQVEHQDLVDTLKEHPQFIQNIVQEFTRLVSGEWFPSDPANQRPFLGRTEDIPSAIRFDVQT